MKFSPLVVLRSGEDILWVAGAEHATRTDGSSSLMVAQVFCAHRDFSEGEVLFDDVGQQWVLTSSVGEGFFMTGIVLEEKEFYARSVE